MPSQRTIEVGQADILVILVSSQNKLKVVRDGEQESHLAVFSIDRICYLSIMDDTFTIPKDFSAQEYFDESFGVVAGDGTPATTIRLRAFGRERYALQDLPIHHSQQLIAQGPDYCDFEVYLRPTADFKAFLASKGQWVVVLSPQSVAEEVIDIHQESIKAYSKLKILKCFFYKACKLIIFGFFL